MSTFKNFDILIIDSNGGCDVLIHLFDTIEGFILNYSANHLLVLFFSTSTIFKQLISIIFFCKDDELFSFLFQYVIF